MLGKKANMKWGVLLAGIVLSTSVFSERAVIAGAAESEPSIIESSGWLESAYVTWSAQQNTGYNVYVNDGNSEYLLDDELIRLYSSDSGENYYRADALGLSEGDYYFTVVPVENGGENRSLAVSSGDVHVMQHDRSGFAFVNGTSNGAYNDDGTLKSDAIVLYITDETKDTVSMDVVTNAKGAVTNAAGLQNILNLYKKGYDSRPLDVRFVGQITDFATMEQGDIVISGSGDSKRISCGITFEGVGNDATADGWGLRIKNASNVEVRNIGFMNCDSGEGDDLGLQQSNDHVWVHNCDFFYGLAGGDADQAKGDGALDTKKSTYVTHSFNHFYDTGKSNLQGMKSESTENYITYHHNWYDHSDSRHPRIRTCTVHIYNNYYDGNAKYGVGVTMGASAFVEANYFRNCKFPMLISEQGSDIISDWENMARDEDLGTFSSENGGIIKSFNNVIEGAASYVTYQENVTEFDAYEASSRDEQVPGDVVAYKGGSSYNNFDTSSIMYSYTVEDAYTARSRVETFAGRENGGDFRWDFVDETDDTDYSVNKALKAALNSYKTKLISVGGNGFSDNGSESAGSASSEDSSEGSGNASSSESSIDEGGNSSSGASNEESGDPVDIPSQGKKAYEQNFTAQGIVSDFFDITGNLSTSKGTVTYDGKLLTQCLKIESKTSIKFTAPSEGKLTLVFGDNNSSIKLDGEAVKDASNVMVLDIGTGTHELTKKDTENLFYMKFEIENADVKEPSSGESEAGSEASSEAGSEASSEASSEAGSEASSEASSEAGSEASSEASSEAGSEASSGASSEETPGQTGDEEHSGEWKTSWGSTYYYFSDGTLATGYQVIDGEEYFFNEKGRMVTNDFVVIDNDKYYFGADGKKIKGFLTKWTLTYHFDEEGRMSVGLTAVDDSVYFFKDNGAMVKGEFVVSNDIKRYFGTDGKMITGWLEKWGTTYYFAEDGAMCIGKTVVGESTYYFKTNGAMLKNDFVTIDEDQYYFGADGKMVTGEMTKWGRKYIFAEDGRLLR